MQSVFQNTDFIKNSITILFFKNMLESHCLTCKYYKNHFDVSIYVNIISLFEEKLRQIFSLAI